MPQLVAMRHHLQHTACSQPRLSILAVQASMEVLGVEWKLVKDDLHRLRQELADRTMRLGKLRAKHETLLAKHGQSAEEQDKSEVRSWGPLPQACVRRYICAAVPPG